MNTDEDIISLRVRVLSGDGPAIKTITGPATPENGLQTLGDWVLAALEQYADDSARAARPMVAALRERDWEGDVELADQLDALLANGVIPDLRPLPVHLDELSDILEGDSMNGGGRIDLQTGDVWPEHAVDYMVEIGEEDEDESEDPDRWLGVHCEGSRDGYRDMERFIGTCVMKGARICSTSLLPGGARSGGSGTSWHAGPKSSSGGTRSRRSASVAGRGPGLLTQAITSAWETGELRWPPVSQSGGSLYHSCMMSSLLSGDRTAPGNATDRLARPRVTLWARELAFQVGEGINDLSRLEGSVALADADLLEDVGIYEPVNSFIDRLE
jgi:hypothetical protein